MSYSMCLYLSVLSVFVIQTVLYHETNLFDIIYPQMNNIFDSLDLQLDKKFENYDSISVLHSLFDGYLQPNLGSQPELSLDFFYQMLETFRAKKSKTLEDSIKARLTKVFALVKHSSVTLNKYMNIVYPSRGRSVKINQIDIPPQNLNKPFENIKSDSLEFINLFFEIPLLSPTGPDLLALRNKSYKFTLEIFDNIESTKNYYRQILNDLSNQLKKNFGELRYSEMIVRSGWSTHLVGFYYKKIADDSYVYGFCNSGDGLQYHEGHKTSEKVSVTKFFSGTLDDLRNMCVHVYMIANLLDSSETSKIEESVLFYELLPTSPSQKVYESPELLEMKWILPQLSGTCTYFGFYYTIKYVFFSLGLKDIFVQFHEHIVETSTDAILTYIEKSPKIQQKQKTFLDLLYHENRNIKTIEFQRRIASLYTRYRADVNEFTVHHLKAEILPESLQLYEVDQDTSNFINILPHPQKVEKNVFEINFLELTTKMDMVMKRYITGKDQISRMEIYLFNIHVIKILVHIITLPDIHYESLDDTFLKNLPSKLCQAMLIWQYFHIKWFIKNPGRYDTSKTIKFLSRLVLLRVNDVRKNFYFTPSKEKYKPEIIYNYSRKVVNWKYNSLVFSSGTLLVSLSSYFDLFIKYYDLLFPSKYYEDDKGRTWFDLISYSSHLTENVIDKTQDGTKFDGLAKQFQKDYSSLFSIIMIMAPNELDVVVYRTYDEGTNSPFGTVLQFGKNMIIVNRYRKRIGFIFGFFKEFDASSAVTTIFEIAKYFASNEITQLNDIFDKSSVVAIQDTPNFYDVHNGTPINIHINLEKSEPTPLTLQSNATIFSGSDYYIQILFFLNDSIDQYYNCKTQTTILLDVENITKMFSVLEDTALLVTLNILLFYHGDDLSDKQKNIIEKECLKRIESQTKYAEVYKIVYLIVSNSENLTFEKNIFDSLKDCFDEDIENIHLQNIRYYTKQSSQLPKYDQVLHLFLMKFYAIQISRMGDSQLSNYVMRIQNSKINSIDKNLRENFAKYLPDGNRETVVDISFQNNIVKIKTHDAQKNEIQHTVLLGEIQKKEERFPDSFFRQFMLKYDNDEREIVGMSENKKLGRVVLIPAEGSRSQNTYSLERVIQLRRDNKVQYVTLFECKTPTYVTDTFFLGNTWLNAGEKFYGNVHFYQENGKSDIYVEFNNFVSPVTKRPLLMKITESEKIFYIDDDLIEHLVCTDKNPFMINQWIYGLPFAFVYRTGLFYNMIYVDSRMSTGNFNLKDDVSVSNWWIGAKIYKKCTDPKFPGDITFDKQQYYHVAQIEYHGLGCNFQSIDDMRSYLFSCIMFQKLECLDIILPKYLVLVKNPSEDLVVKLLREGFSNNPYSHYFTNMVGRITTNNIIDEEYQTRIERNIYGKKFSFDHEVKNFVTDIQRKLLQHDISGLDLFDVQSDVSTSSKALKIAETELGKYTEGKKGEHVQNIISTLTAFVNSYETCRTKPINTDYLKKKLLELEETYTTILQDLETQNEFTVDLFNIPRDEFIVKKSNSFYSLLIVKTNHSVIKDIIKYSNNSECLEMKAVHDKINTLVLYEPIGIRPTEVILFEILFGWFIRKDQFQIYSNISNSIDASGNSNYLVHQLLMGKGKTAVIMPLLMLHYLYQNPHDVRNIFLVLPKHLTYATYKMLFDKFYPILNKTLVKSVTITRYSDSDDETNISFKNYIEGITEYDYTKKVYIMSDSSCKSIKLNTRYLDNYSKDILLKRMRESSVFIFDEFDNQYDPSTSDLNFPITADTLGKTPIIDSRDQHLFMNFISDNIAMFNTGREAFYTQFKNYAKQSANGSHASLLNQEVKSAQDFKNKCTVHHLLSQLFSCKNMIYLKDYGFPNEDSHYEEMRKFAVPYNAVDTPVPGSEFSDTDIALLLTIFAYMYHVVRLEDVIDIIKKLQHNCNKFGNDIGEDHLNVYFKRTKEQLRLNSVLDVKDIPGDKIRGYAQSVVYPKISQREFKFFYLETEVLPKIHFTYTQDNCSFMDIITEKYSLYKAAFTGTIHINLPHYEDPNRVFVKTEENPLSAGATYAAILGIYHPNRKVMTVSSDVDDSMLDYLIDLIKKNKYNVFIDSGAYLRLHKLDYVVKKFQEKLEDIQYIIYVNDEDVVTILDNGKEIEYTEQTGSFDKNKMFIYYDNKHIVGTDIKQPYHLSGLISVSNFNDLVDISQATFRMRNLNYGHTADFILKDISCIDTNEKLLIHLHNKTYDKLHGSMQIKKYEQEIKSRYRVVSDKYHTENVFNKYLLFADRKTYETYGSNSADDVLTKLYENHIRVGWLADSNQVLTNLSLDKLYEKVKELLVSKTTFEQNINQNQTKEVESDQSKISNQEIARVLRATDKKNILTSFIIRKNLTFNSYFSKKEWENIYDYTSNPDMDELQKKKVTLLQLCNHRDVYFSPLFFDFNHQSFELFFMLYLKTEFTHNFPRYRKMLHAFNYYYIKIQDSYLLISPRECEMLLFFLKDHDDLMDQISEPVIIKDKRGNILYGKSSDDDIITAKELLVRMILGKIMTTTENLFIIAYLRENKVLLNFLKELEKFYDVPFYDYDMYDKHVEKSIDEFSTILQKAHQNDPESISFIFGDTFVLSSDDISSKVVTLILDKFIPIYESKSSLRRALLDVTAYIDKPKRIDMFPKAKILSSKLDEQLGGYRLYLEKKIQKYKSRYLRLKSRYR